MTLLIALLTLIIASCSFVLWCMHRRLTYWQRRGIPHDAPHLLRGNFQELRTKCHLQDICRYYYTKYKGTGPFAGFYLFQQPAAFILDLDLAKNVLIKDFSCFSDRPAYYNEKDDPVSAHLFALDGNKWKELRQKLSPTFSTGKMKFMFPTVLEVGQRFIDTLDSLLRESAVVELKELLARYTTDVIGSCAFGIECNSLSDPHAEFRIMGRRMISERKHSALVLGLAQSYPKLARKLGIAVVHGDVSSFFLRLVRETIAQRERLGIRRNDFMDMLIELKHAKAPGKSPLTVEQIAAQAFIFFLGGFETSSTTSSFALYELAQHQDVQQKLRQEICQVLAKHDNVLTYECLKEMKYLDQVIAETLRLYTVIPALLRRCLKDYVVPGQPKYTIEKGTSVIIPATAIHRDPELYAEPNTFNPDHFAPEQLQARHSLAWLAFGDGPRNCIGMRFGRMQTRIGLALLLQRYKFTLDTRTPVPMLYENNVTICSAKDGIYLKMERLQD